MDEDTIWYTEVGLVPGDIVLNGDSAPLERGTTPPIFGPMSSLLWRNGWMDQDATWYEYRPWPRPHCVTWDPGGPPSKRGAAHNFRPMSIVAKRSPISATTELLSSFTYSAWWRQLAQVLRAGCPSSWYPTNSVKSLKETQSSDPSQGTCLILSWSTEGLRREGAWLHLCRSLWHQLPLCEYQPIQLYQHTKALVILITVETSQFNKTAH